jgi:hypothetical protein
MLLRSLLISTRKKLSYPFYLNDTGRKLIIPVENVEGWFLVPMRNQASLSRMLSGRLSGAAFF